MVLTFSYLDQLDFNDLVSSQVHEGVQTKFGAMARVVRPSIATKD